MEGLRAAPDQKPPRRQTWERGAGPGSRAGGRGAGWGVLWSLLPSGGGLEAPASELRARPFRPTLAPPRQRYQCTGILEVDFAGLHAVGLHGLPQSGHPTRPQPTFAPSASTSEKP